jgi:antirestriction protein ArdC
MKEGRSTRKEPVMKKSAYDRVTERMLELLEKGVCPWRRPWNRLGGRPRNFVSDRPYSGVNWFLLEAMAFDLPWFMTFNQVKAKGGKIIKGSKGIPVVYWGKLEAKQDEPKEEGEETRKIPFLKAYVVFNACHVEGVDFPEVAEAEPLDFSPIEAAERVVKGWSDAPEVLHGYRHACYISATDEIQLPPKARFASCEEYYATRFHEMGHATGAKSRLDRKLEGTFGDGDYSREELIAEMTAAFLCAHCGIDNSVVENSAAYLQGWIRILKGDSKLVVTAASQAQKSANLILGAFEE